MIGYYKNKQATDEVIKADEKGTRWVHTGDLGYVDEDGFVFIKGRLKRIFTTFGSDGSMYKLFPQRIEEFISKMTEVLACGIVVKEDPEKSHIAIAYVEPQTKAATKMRLNVALWNT